VVFPIVDSYSQYEKEKYARIKKRKRKSSLPMVAMWKRSEVLHYRRHSWMTDAHFEISRITQAFCSHLTHLDDAFTIQEIWQMIATLKSQEGDVVSGYVKEYGLQWIDTSTERVVLPTYSSTTALETGDSSSGLSLSAEFPFLPPDLVEEASINAEDVRLIQSKAHKKRKFDHSQISSEQERNGLGLEGREGTALPALSCDRLLLSGSREVQDILQFTLSASATVTASSSSSAPQHPLLDANKEFLTACSSLSVLAGKCALKLLTTPHDVVASNLLIREFNCHSRDAMMSYETHHPFEKLHLRQFLKYHPPPPPLTSRRSHPSCPFALLLCGHYHACRHRYATALDHYLDALYFAPDEPLIALCLSIFFIFLSLQSHTTAKQDICLRGMTIYSHYTQLRLQQTQQLQAQGQGHLVTQSCQQEIFYNLALLFHQIKLTHLSEHYLKKVLALEDQRGEGQRLPLTAEAAHHLVIIYRESENESLAAEIMERYLTFD
jgi:hypothetical protein